METPSDVDRTPITDPESERWAGWRGEDSEHFFGPHHDSLRREAFQRRVLEGLALREAGQAGHRFKLDAVLDEARGQWRMALRVLAEGELETLEDPSDIELHRLVVDHAKREVVLVADQRESAFSAIEAVRAMVREPGQPTHGYTTRAIVAVFLDTPGEAPFHAHPYELLTLTHYAPELVVLVGQGAQASEDLARAVAQPEATFARLYDGAIAFLTTWRLADDRTGAAMNSWLQVVARAIHEDELRGRSPPSKALAEAFGKIPKDDVYNQTRSQKWVEDACIHGFEPLPGTRRVSFQHCVYDPSVLDN